MDKMLVVVFDDEKSAFEGEKLLEALHYEEDITLYSKAVIRRNSDGKIEYLTDQPAGPLGTAVGLLVGALIGAVGGPAGVAVGAYVGTFGGVLFDLAKLGVSEDFIDEVKEYLVPGRIALVAEIGEDEVMPIDIRMESLGGTVFRRTRGDIVDAQLERDAAIFESDIADLEAELKSANAEAKATIQAKIDSTKAKLHATQEKAKATAEEAKREMEAKINSLNEQIESANAEAKAKLEKRAAEIKADHDRRIEKLKKSWERTQEAAANWRYAQTHVS
jgi:uncharacterized membrane protein